MKKVNAKPPGRNAAKTESNNLSVPASSRLCVKSENDISREIVRCAIETHRTLGGPGLLESVYEEALAWELSQSGLAVKRQVSLPIPYKGQTLASPLRIDLIIENKVIIECKATSKYNEIFEAQTLTYLRLTGLKLGLVINFGERMVKNGIHRVVNGL
jgi:GxxExxY protein